VEHELAPQLATHVCNAKTYQLLLLNGVVVGSSGVEFVVGVIDLEQVEDYGAQLGYDSPRGEEELRGFTLRVGLFQLRRGASRGAREEADFVACWDFSLGVEFF